GEQIRQMVAARRDAAGLRGVMWFEVGLLAALLGFLVARAAVLVEMLGGAATARQIAAAETYNLVFTSLALVAGGLVVAPERTGRVLLTMSQRPALLLISSFA